LVETAAHLINRAAVLSHPGIDLLHNTSFVKDDLITSFSASFVFVHIAIAIRGMAENTNVSFLGCMTLASSASFKKFGSLVFSNHPLPLATTTDLLESDPTVG
jgi:hypothetical protein